MATIKIKEEEVREDYLAETDEDDDDNGKTPSYLNLLPLSDKRSNVQMVLAQLVKVQMEAKPGGGESYNNLCSVSWEDIDFGRIDKALARKLSDDDMAAILMVTNAVDTVKTLKLDHCVNITGRGLNVLRGSTVLEEIDFSTISRVQGLVVADSLEDWDKGNTRELD